MVVALVLDMEFHVAFPHKVGVLGKHNITISENKIFPGLFYLGQKVFGLQELRPVVILYDSITTDMVGHQMLHVELLPQHRL